MKQGKFPSVIKLGDLNGQNGFKIDGEPGGGGGGAYTGIAISNIGGINSDGYQDLLIGAYNSYLAAYDRNHNNDTLTFVPTALSHGYFVLTSAPNISINNFTQQQVVNNEIQFTYDGSFIAPSYNISVYSSGIAWTGPIACSINFSTHPVIVNNQLVINQGENLIMSPTFLKVIDGYPAAQVLYFIVYGEAALFPLSRSSNKVVKSLV